MWRWCDKDKWRVENKHSSMILRVILTVYMFEILSKTLLNIFYQRLRNIEFESQISGISPSLLSPLLQSYLLLSSPLQSYPLLSPKLLSPPSILSSTSMVSHRYSPPQPLSHEIFLIQMDALDSYHVSNLKFRYLKSNYVIS